MMKLTFPIALAAALALAPSLGHAQSDPRYFNQMRAELQAMGLAAQCAAVNPQAGACRVVTSAQPAPGAAMPLNARRYTLVLDYSDQTDTHYVYLERYATLRGDAAGAPAVFRRMAEMNWEMLVGKLEWSTRTGEVRLSAVLNTDSNFDRRAFRGVVRALLRLGDRYAEEMAHLTGSAVGESAAAATPMPAAPAPAAPTAPGAALTPIAAPR